MAQPIPYNRVFSFQQFSVQHPGEQQPGTQLDAEYNGIKTTLDGTLANLALIQRDDGRLANATVYWDTLAPEVQNAILGNGGVEPTPGGGTGGGTDGGTVIGGQGVIFFRQLYDAPKSYGGQGGKVLRVRADETGIEFFTPTTPAISFLSLTDSPDTYAGAGGRTLRVSPNGAYLEFADIKTEPGATYARLDQANNWGGNEQTNLTLRGYSETVQNLGDISGNVILDLSAGPIIRARCVGNINWALSSTTAAGKARSFTLFLENAGAFSHSWFLGTTWRTTAPALATTGFEVLSFVAFSDVVFAFRAEA